MSQVGGYIGNSPGISSPANFSGGNGSAGSLHDFAKSIVVLGSAPGIFKLTDVYTNIKANTWVNKTLSSVSPTAGGTLTIDSLSLGSYDYVIKQGSQTISSFTNSDWFTTTEDSRSAFIYVNGNLTINSGQTFIPSNRKLFTCIYVNGNLTVNGTISMTGRGANHSSGAGNVTKQNIKLIASGTYSGVTNPQIPASGGAGAAGNSVVNASRTGNAGTAGTAGGTGGGGSGGTRSNAGLSATTGTGAGGTSFSGGSGSGGSWGDYVTASSQNAYEDGGAGGAGGTASLSSGVFGGAGNPVGAASGTGSGDQSTDSGTGGILVIYCTGTFSGTGAIEAKGMKGGWRVGYTTSDGSRGTSGGGGSGGGSINIFYGTDSSSITPSASGGAGGNTTGQCASGTCNGGEGGAGGAGTARKLSITAS